MAHRNPVENMGIGNLSNQFSMASRKSFISDINPGLKKGFNFVSTGLGNTITKNKKGLMYDDEDVETSMYFQNHLYPFNSDKEYISTCSPLTFSNNSTYQSQTRRRNDVYFNQFRNNSSPTSYQTSTPPSLYGSNFTPSAFFSHNRSITSQTVSQSTRSHPFGQNYTSVIGNNHSFSIIGKQRNLNSAFQQGGGFGSYSSSNYSNSKSGRTFNETNPLGLDLSEFPSLRQTKGAMAVGSNLIGGGGSNSASAGPSLMANFDNNPGQPSSCVFPLGGLMNGNGPSLGSAFGPAHPSGNFYGTNTNTNAAANSMALMAAAQQFSSFGGASGNLASALRGPYGMVKQSVSESQQEFQMHSEDFPALPGPQQSQSSFVKDALNIFDYNLSASVIASSTGLGTTDPPSKANPNPGPSEPGAPSNSLPDHAPLLGLKRANFSSATNVRSLFPPLDGPGSVEAKTQADPPTSQCSDAPPATRGVPSFYESGSLVLPPSGGGGGSNVSNQALRSNSTPLMDSFGGSGPEPVGGADKERPTTNARVPTNPDGAATQRGIITHPDGRVTNIPPSMVPGAFGMVGLLAFIRTAETAPNLVQLGLGSDLTTFGLNLNSSEPLYVTFGGPFSETACKPHEIEYSVPSEYLIGSQIREKLPPSPPMAKVGEDTLFFIFYAFANDAIQLVAAQELYNRDWRFHLDERVWLIKIPGMHTSEKTPSYERGTYYFFDPQLWRKVPKEFLIYYNKLEDRPVVPANIAPSTSSSPPSYPAAPPSVTMATGKTGGGGYPPFVTSHNTNGANQFSPFSLLTPSQVPSAAYPNFHLQQQQQHTSSNRLNLN